MMKLNFFRKKESKEKELSKDELTDAIKKQIEELYEYSTETLEQIINLENKLKELENLNIKLEEQSTIAYKKNNTHLYERALSKLSLNKIEYANTRENIKGLKEKLKIAIGDIKSLENSLVNL